jgi:hypothetical protein
MRTSPERLLQENGTMPDTLLNVNDGHNTLVLDATDGLLHLATNEAGVLTNLGAMRVLTEDRKAAWKCKDFAVTATLAATEYPLFTGSPAPIIDAAITSASIRKVVIQNLYGQTILQSIVTSGAPGVALQQYDCDSIEGQSAWNAIVKCDVAGKVVSVRVFYV